jgi:hypothetical protein
MLCRTCWLRTKLWGAIWVWKSTLWSPTWTFSPENLGEVSAEHGERFHQDTLVMEKWYQGWLWKSGTKASTSSMLAEYCWTLKRDVPDAQIPAKVIGLNILEESFFLFHEHVKYYFAHLNSSVSLKPCLIEKFCIHIWILHKKCC